MKKHTSLFFAFLIGMALVLTSCSKSQEYEKLISADADVVIRLDVKQIIEKSGVADNKELKAKLTESLQSESMPEKIRTKLNKIIEDPAELGLDLRQPVLYSFKVTNGTEGFTLATAVYDRDKVEEWLNLVAEEDGKDKVKTKDDMSRVMIDGVAFIFDKKNFYMGECRNEAELDRLAADVKEKIEGKGKNTMAEDENLQKMTDAKGFMQLYVTGEVMNGAGIQDLAKASAAPLPDISELDYIFDLDATDGEAKLTTEVIAKTEKWQKLLEKGGEICENIKGKYADYISDEGLAVFMNMNGEKLFSYLEEMNLLENLSGDKNQLKELLTSIDGELAFSISDFDTNTLSPKASFYAATDNNKILETLASLQGQQLKSEGKDKYSLVLPAHTTGMGALTAGWEDKATYFVMGSDNKPFEKAKNAIDTSNLKGKKFYMKLNVGSIVKLIAQFAGAFVQQGENKDLMNILNDINSLELYSENTTTSVLCLNLKNEKVNPLKYVVDTALKYADTFMSGSRQPALADYEFDEAADGDYVLDSVAVEEY